MGEPTSAQNLDKLPFCLFWNKFAFRVVFVGIVMWKYSF